MSQVLIQQYLNQLQDLRKVSGTHRESVVREAFKDLLKGWARSHDLVFIPEYEIETRAKDRRYVDGALLYELRMPFGYWEAKDEKDDLDAEIEHKFRRGYPQDNIIFEDSTEAVLIQNRQEVMRCGVDDVAALEKLLGLFFGYERAEIAEFRKAVEQFKADLPAVLDSLRRMIARSYEENAAFRKASQKFLVHAQEAINPSLTDADVREMLIQHVLTEEIFSKVFGEDDFHQHNNVARELYALEETFFTGDLKKRTLRGLDSYYAAIRSAAAQIGSHHEKQAFLKVIYESFYKIYNKKAADRLGVVYMDRRQHIASYFDVPLPTARCGAIGDWHQGRDPLFKCGYPQAPRSGRTASEIGHRNAPALRRGPNSVCGSRAYGCNSQGTQARLDGHC